MDGYIYIYTHTQTQKQIHRCIIINEYIIINLKVIAIKYEYLFPVGTEIKLYLIYLDAIFFHFFPKQFPHLKLKMTLHCPII